MLNKLEIELENFEATENFACEVGKKLDRIDAITLRGDLGVGKTSFTRELIKSIVGKDTIITSPTFTLTQTYESDKGLIWHYDLYRIKYFSQIYELSIEDALQNIMIIEWPEIIEPILPENRLDIYLRFSDKENARKALLLPYGKWQSKITTFKV